LFCLLFDLVFLFKSLFLGTAQAVRGVGHALTGNIFRSSHKNSIKPGDPAPSASLTSSSSNPTAGVTLTNPSPTSSSAALPQSSPKTPHNELPPIPEAAEEEESKLIK
jgi:hypothetical protein